MDTIEQQSFDAVIVGSGISGAVIAKTLTDAGKRVLLLDAGLESGMALNGLQAYRNQMAYLDTFYKATAKSPNSPYPNLMNAPSSDVLEVQPVEQMDHNSGYLVQKGPLPFGSDNWVGPGGTTQHWLGTTLRMLPNDFQMKTMYGHGVDWPIRYQDLRCYYEMAEFEIGVAGSVEEQKLPNIGNDYFSEGYVFPMEKIPQSFLDKRMLQRTNGLVVDHLYGPDKNKSAGKHVIHCCSTPQGRNSNPNAKYRFERIAWSLQDQKLNLIRRSDTDRNGYEPVGSLWDRYTGQRCEGNAACVPICPVQAKYNALKTLKRAKEANPYLLEIRSQAVACEVIVDKDSRRISGVRYKRYESAESRAYREEVATGKVYILAASAIENAKLLLASNAANSSDQVGRNLMDHMCLLTWGLFPEPVYPFRGPGSTTNISSFRDGEFRHEHAAWICPIDNWGWGWPAFSPGTDVQEAVEKGKFGKQLRKDLSDELTKQVLLHFECEQDPEPENRVTIDPKYKDRLGNYRPVIHYNASEYVKKAFQAAKLISNQIFAKNGIEDKTEYTSDDPDYWEYKGEPYTSRGAGHIVGTHRMGSDRRDSVVDADMRTWDHENLFLAGCGNMPTLGTSNPTLTMTALVFKSAAAILRQLEAM
jgi:choline dehydrogenase-like flavoprotein